MASRYAGVAHPGRPPYTLRRPKNLRRMVGELFSLLFLKERNLHGQSNHPIQTRNEA